MAVLGFLRLIPAWAWIAAGLLVAGLYYGHLRYEAGQDDVQAKWDALNAKQDAENRAKEAEWQSMVYDLAYKLRMQEIAGEDARRDVLDGLADGSVRVQPRLQCPKLPKSPGSPAGNDDSAPTGFTEQDAASALNIAADGDTYARRLYACQTYVTEILGESK